MNSGATHVSIGGAQGAKFAFDQRPSLALGVEDFFELGRLTAFRGQLVSDRVDLEAGLIELQGKTGARIVPLRSDLISLLSSLDQSTSTVLGVSTLTARHPGGYLAPACEAAGVRYFTMHGLRRLAVDRLAPAGIDIGTAAAILGHKPEIMLAKYRQVGLDERRRAVAALDRLPRGEVVSLPQAVGGFGGHRPRSQGDDDLGGL